MPILVWFNYGLIIGFFFSFNDYQGLCQNEI